MHVKSSSYRKKELINSDDNRVKNMLLYLDADNQYYIHPYERHFEI